MRGQRSKHERIVIIKNLFDPQQFIEQMDLIIDFQKDLREECSKCGTVRKVTIFDVSSKTMLRFLKVEQYETDFVLSFQNHPDGVAQVNMADADEADLVVQLLNHRFFGTRRLLADIWDGTTNYKYALL